MKLFSSAIAAFLLLFALALPSMASAAPPETADADLEITPISGNTFYNNAFKAANWKIDTSISVPSGTPKITPMKVVDLGLPPNSALTFNPKPSMPVCGPDQIGPPPINMSVTVPVILARCPDSVIGNGTALFGLAQSTAPNLTRHGEIIVFNGGLDGGLPKIKIYAYSYETTAGIYTEATLQPDGQLKFNIPVLTSDSSVRTMNIAIPSKKTVIEKPNLALTVTLPAGLDPSFAQAKCVGNAGFPWTADFTMGSRDELTGLPTGDPEFFLSDSGTDPCTGVKKGAKPRLGAVRVIGPARAVRNRPTTYRIVIRNTGNATITGARLVMYGRGIRVNAPAGRIAAGRSRTVRVRARFRLRGLSRTTVKVTTQNAGRKVVRKNVRVR